MTETLVAWSRWLAANHGINLSIIHDAYDRDMFLKGLVTTIDLSLRCVVLSIVFGIVGAALLGSRLRLVRGLVHAYVEAFRNTPPLIQLLFFFFAVSPLLPLATTGSGAAAPLISNYGWAVIAISLFAGAHNVEVFRSGIEAVPAPMIEAAESLGYSRLRIFREITFPLAFRICLPALNNNTVNTIKTTTLAYAIAVPELLYASAQIWSESLNVREIMNVLLLVFLLLVAVVVWIMDRVERRLRIPGYSL